MESQISKTAFKPVSTARNESRVLHKANPCRILIANAKGGCGKTTLATNLSSYFASHDFTTALIDYDPQGSSVQWLQARSKELPNIYGVAAYRRAHAQATRTWQLKVPFNTSHIVIDTPAGLTGNELSDLIRQADIILMPVIPSAIDIRAATNFIKEVLLSQAFRSKPKPIAVIANRVKKNTLIYAKLELFLRSLNIPFITSLRDTQHYVRASEHGLGIHDFSQPNEIDMKEWQPLIGWLKKQLSTKLNK